MTMQVASKTLNTSPAGVSDRIGIDASRRLRASVAPDKPPLRRPPFPEAALISARPLRYNVQLNQQLTAVQQADSYLAATETQLLQLRHAASRGTVKGSNVTLTTLIARRASLSAHTIDREFELALQKTSQVKFTLAGAEKWLSHPGEETLIFALAGEKRELAAVMLPKDSSPTQALMRLNNALGRLGITARQQHTGLVFRVDEARWPRVSQHLSVRGEGKRYPADAFTLLAPQAQAAREDMLIQLARQQDRAALNTLQPVLDHITRQRGQLRRHQERVASRIEDMTTWFDAPRAQIVADALGASLASAQGDYRLLSQALNAQANLPLATVKNLLE